MAPDFEQQKRARDKRKRLYGEIFDAADDVIFVHDPETGLILDANEAALALYGWTPEEMRGMSVLDFSAEEHDYTEADVMELVSGASHQAYLRFEWCCRRKTGETFWVDVGLKRVQIAGEERVIGVVRDIAERKREEIALRRSEQREGLRRRIAETFLTVPDDDMYAALLPIFLEATGSEIGVFGYLNERGDLVAPTMTSAVLDVCEVEGKRWVFEREMWGDSAWPRAIREKRIVHSNEPAGVVPEGHIAIRNHVSVPILHREDVIGLFQVANKPTDYDEEDLTLLQELADAVAPTLRARLERDRQAVARAEAEASIRRLLARNEAILGAVPDIIMEVDNDRTYTWANEAGLAFFGPDVVGRGAADYFIGTQDTYAQVQSLFNGSDDPIYVESWQRRTDGEERLLGWWCRVLHGPDGAVAGALSTARDVTDSKRTEEALRQSEQRFRAWFDNAPTPLGVSTDEGRYLDTNAALSKLVGYTREELAEIDISTLYEDPTVRQGIRATLKAGGVVRGVEVGIVRKDGEIRRCLTTMEPFVFLGEETLLSTALDITDRRELEAQLLQAQKMEAVGQLAGGVAHDFNNILQTIIGYTDIALRQTAEDDPNTPRLQKVLHSAERAAALTKQLLAFSRRQVMKPRRIDVGELVTALSRMLRRVLGEDIEVVLRTSDAPVVVRADTTQIEQVLMNLCVNARDAMPNGGRLIIETDVVEVPEARAPGRAAITPGAYARIRVEDTGCGIPPDHLEHIFEPFFTTKPEGKGTGLGLSTAYGVIRQHEGFMDVQSEPDQGTTISVFLPVVTDPAERSAVVGTKTVPRGGTETILVAEDDRMVREMVTLILEDAGYTAIQAADGLAAMELFDSQRNAVDLAILDVLMPKAGGREVYEHIHAVRADLPVLFSSGYSADAISDRFMLDAGMQLMQKPFAPDALLQHVRELLDGQTGEA